MGWLQSVVGPPLLSVPTTGVVEQGSEELNPNMRMALQQRKEGATDRARRKEVEVRVVPDPKERFDIARRVQIRTSLQILVRETKLGHG